MSLHDIFQENYELANQLYSEYNKNITHTAVELSERLGLEYTDSVRRVFSRFVSETLDPTRNTDDKSTSKILIYDIETSRVRADVWWTGKQYISHTQLKEEPKIISIAWKWLGDDKVYHATWDVETKCEKKMLNTFLNYYNAADVIITQNGDNFDNRFINARAMKHNMDVNVFIRSFDIMKQTKRLFRLPSYSMEYITKFLGVEGKYKHYGVQMWDDIQNGEIDIAKKALKEMVMYNIQDIVATEQMYLRLRKYMGNVVHTGVMDGGEKWTCPNCGGSNVELYKTTVTPAGTLQRIMICKDDKVQYKVSNKVYMAYLEEKLKSLNNN